MENLSNHTQIIEKINTLLDKYQSDLSYCHGADHVRRVAKIAVTIGTIEKADCKIIEIAALLHDIGVVPLAWSRHASGADYDDFQEFLGLYALPSADHGEVGALIAERFLEQLDYPNAKRRHVKQIISEHTKWMDQTTLESRIVNDADKLEMLGATWVARAFQRTSAFDRHLGIESVPERLLNNKEKLLPNSFHTETAKTMAEKRHGFLISFNKQFQRELRLEV
ncbi:MAG: HD domain-containing protein [Dehalococcoidales bacterium]|nr:HD domain-containing protein [Dehalococcoidales bacterium]